MNQLLNNLFSASWVIWNLLHISPKIPFLWDAAHCEVLLQKDGQLTKNWKLTVLFSQLWWPLWYDLDYPMGCVCMCNVGVLWLNSQTDRVGFWYEGCQLATQNSYFVLDGIWICPWSGRLPTRKEVKIPTFTNKFTFVKQYGYHEPMMKMVVFMFMAVVDYCSTCWAFIGSAIVLMHIPETLT